MTKLENLLLDAGICPTIIWPAPEELKAFAHTSMLYPVLEPYDGETDYHAAVEEILSNLRLHDYDCNCYYCKF